MCGCMMLCCLLAVEYAQTQIKTQTQKQKHNHKSVANGPSIDGLKVERQINAYTGAFDPSCSKLPWLPLLNMATVGAAHECTSQYTQFQSVGIGCSVNTAWQPLVYHSESCTNKRLEVLRI